MGMVVNSFCILAITESQKPIYLEYGLPNELCPRLRRDKNLFNGVKNTADLIEKIGYGFYEEENEEIIGNVIKALFEAFEDDDYFSDESTMSFYEMFYEELSACHLDEIKTIILMTDNSLVSERDYEWMRYDLKTGKSQTGSERVKEIDGHCMISARDYLSNIGNNASYHILSDPNQTQKSMQTKPVISSQSMKLPDPELSGKMWLERYERFVSKEPTILFSGKLFVFSGLTLHSEEKEHPTVQAVISRGGEYRTKVSGKTDYLVVEPKRSGDSKIKAAIEQMHKGKIIKIVLLEDLQKALKEKESISASHIALSENRSSGEIDTSAPATASHLSGAAYRRNTGNESPLRNTTNSAQSVIPYASESQRIKSFAFSNSTMESINIHEGIRVIEDRAFALCKNLKYVTLPKSLVYLSGFNCCTSLEEITIPQGVQIIGEEAFCGTKLKKVYIPSSVEEIRKKAFFICYDLEEVTIPQGVRIIGEEAFCRTKLKKVHIPPSVEEIGKKAFSSCEYSARE